MSTHESNERRDVLPAEPPPNEGVVTDHFLDHFIPLVNTQEPADGNTLHAHESDDAHACCSVRI